MANMRKERYQHAMTSNGKLIFVLGGFFTPYDLEALDPSVNTWHVLSSLPDRSINIGAVHMPWGQVVVTGGGSDAIYVYNISDDTWTLSNITLNKTVEHAGMALL